MSDEHHSKLVEHPQDAQLNAGLEPLDPLELSHQAPGPVRPVQRPAPRSKRARGPAACRACRADERVPEFLLLASPFYNGARRVLANLAWHQWNGYDEFTGLVGKRNPKLFVLE